MTVECAHNNLFVSALHIYRQEMIQSAAHEAQVTWQTLPAALKMPALNSTKTKNKPKLKNHK